MPPATENPLFRAYIYIIVMLGGVAALSWEVMWQIKSSLALGVSAFGTALTLAVTMGGMSIGSFLMGRALKNRILPRPMRVYGTIEGFIGIAGLFLGLAFRTAEKLDTWAYASLPGAASLVHIFAIVLALGVPTICMGATLPVLGLVGRQFQISIATLYGLNTLGAACGALLAAFLLIPQLGVTHATWIIAGINIIIGALTWISGARASVPLRTADKKKPPSSPSLSPATAQLIVIVTGFATFTLEIAWFRSLTAAFNSTTDAFAIMLASVLIALGIAARLVPTLKKKQVKLGALISLAGVFILLATPLVERFDLVMNSLFPVGIHDSSLPSQLLYIYSVLNLTLNRFIMTFCVIGPPILLLGIAFPWTIDDRHSPRDWGKLNALNTLAAIIGSVSAAWIFLPSIGFARTAWLAGILVTVAGVLIAPRRKRMTWAVLGGAALMVAVMFESGVGTTRAQGLFFYANGKPGKLLEAYEGPASTVSVVEYRDGGRGLLIDGAAASGQSGGGTALDEHYMAWMGYLPMLLHPDPKNALVICFGTGQTANAVRRENPQSLDIVDINPHVFQLAHNFTANQDVLADPRVKSIVMDGRAYMRRTQKTYDVITLEPMPPVMAGVNALYSREFYELARQKLGPKGVIAQWLPFHGVSPYYGASIARTFQDVFPNAVLWMDPVVPDGIIIGAKDDDNELGSAWPGFERGNATRNLSDDEVLKAVFLDRKEMQRYGSYGEIISDDNQLLAYGDAVYSTYRPPFLASLKDRNFDFLNRVIKQVP